MKNIKQLINYYLCYKPLVVICYTENYHRKETRILSTVEAYAVPCRYCADQFGHRLHATRGT